MKVSSTIKLNMGRMAKLTKAQRMALEMTAEAVHTDMVQSQVIPFDTGNLQNTQTFVDYSDSASGKITIAFNTPYARRLYYHPEFNFTKSENPNAKGRWAEDYLENGSKKDFARKTYKQLYKKLGGI